MTCTFVPVTGQGWSVEWSTATACLTSLLTPNSSHIHLISTGKHPASLCIWRTHAVMNIGTAWHLFFCCGRFVQYKATSLEKQHKHELLTEPDLGVTIDLINPDTYRIDPNSKSPVVVTCHILFFFSQVLLCFIKSLCRLNHSFILSVLLDPADEKLLEEDIQAPSSSKR